MKNKKLSLMLAGILAFAMNGQIFGSDVEKEAKRINSQPEQRGEDDSFQAGRNLTDAKKHSSSKKSYKESFFKVYEFYKNRPYRAAIKGSIFSALIAFRLLNIKYKFIEEEKAFLISLAVGLPIIYSNYKDSKEISDMQKL